jgi:hypothetical protein
MLKLGKKGNQHKTPKMTTYSNRCCLCLRKGMIEVLLQFLRPKGQVISATDIININIILTIGKKTVGNEKMSRHFTTKSVL